MSKKIKQQTENKSIESDNSTQRSILEKNIFPMPICLHKSDFKKIDKKILRENATGILHTLYSFSDEYLYNNKAPHNLENSRKLKKYFKTNEKVISLDIKSSGNKNSTRGNLRLFYTKDNDTCKILALCSDESHK